MRSSSVNVASKSAEGGSPTGESLYAFMLLDTARDVSAASYWAQKGANDGDQFGRILVQHIEQVNLQIQRQMQQQRPATQQDADQLRKRIAAAALVGAGVLAVLAAVVGLVTTTQTPEYEKWRIDHLRAQGYCRTDLTGDEYCRGL